LLEEETLIPYESALHSGTSQELFTTEKNNGNDLPTALLAQYPALANINLDYLPPAGPFMAAISEDSGYGSTDVFRDHQESRSNTQGLETTDTLNDSHPPDDHNHDTLDYRRSSIPQNSQPYPAPSQMIPPFNPMEQYDRSQSMAQNIQLEKTEQAEQDLPTGDDLPHEQFNAASAGVVVSSDLVPSNLPPIPPPDMPHPTELPSLTKPLSNSRLIATTNNSPLLLVPPDRTTSDPPLPPIPSDSGYHSGLGTDTESVCSMDSVGSSVGVPQNFLQDFIAYFGDTLIQKAGAREWAGYALVHRSSAEIEKQLNSLLKKYTIEMASNSTNYWDPVPSNNTSHSPNSSQRHVLAGAASLIRRYRPKISRYFCDNAASMTENEVPFSERLRGLGQQLSLNERLGLLAKSGVYTHDPGEDDWFSDLCTDLQPIRELLVSNAAFNRLALELRRALYSDDTLEMERVRLAILEGKQGPLCNAQFNVNWTFVDFMQAQYGRELPSIYSVVVLTGSALYAQATTCGEYIKEIWPKTGAFLIAALDAILQQPSLASAKTTPLIIHQDHGTFPLRVTITATSNGNFDFFVQAEDEMLVVEIAQQLAWIGSAFSASPFGEQLTYARPSLRKTSSSSSFEITFEHSPLHTTEQACWLPLFCGAAIASGFPIPDRGSEIGLEIPLDLLAGIAGARHAVEFEGGVVMKGFSHMFIPVRKMDDRIQWHAVTSNDPETRLSYQDALSHCKSRALLQEVSLVDLQTCRAIVGWCSVATSRLGSDLANYENIDYSGAQDADSAIRCAGGSLGFQQFGMASLDFKFGVKEGKCHFQRSGPYQRIVSAAEKTPVVLYDTYEQRAWLVPASSVMLHMVQHRHWLEPFEINGKRIKLDTNVATDSTAKKVLLRNESTILSNCDDYTFKNVVLNIWSLLEFLIDQNVYRDRNAHGTSVKPTCRDFINGFEFKAVVEERSPFRQKQASLEKTNGGWPQLVRDIDALVLLANGFEDLILPADQGNTSVCRQWKRVPKEKDYLATSTKMLKELYEVAGCRLSRKYLTSTHLQWHQGSSGLLDSCAGSDACRCNPLQQIYPKSTVGTIVPPKHIAAQGGVIFGQSRSMAKDLWLKPRAQTPKTSTIYSQANIQLTPTIIRPESEESAISDDDTRARSGSDATTESTPPTLSSCSTLSTQDTLLDPHEFNTDTVSSPYSRKRLRMPETPIRMSSESGDEHEPSSAFTHKRAKSEQSYIAPYLSPLQCKGSGLEESPAPRHCDSGSSMPIMNKHPADHDESGLVLPFPAVRNDEHDDFETSLSSPSLPMRSADEVPPRALRRRECFHWKNGVQG
jgi:hypothetical protein